MADQKISTLPAAGAAVGTDQHEINQGGVSKRLTNAQIATLIETILTKLILSGGKIALNADGSATFAAAAIQIDALGNLFINGTSIQEGVTSAFAINGDGSAQFATGVVSITPGGDVLSLSLSINAGVATINSSGDLNAVSLTADVNDVKVQTVGKGFVLKSPDSTQWRLQVSNAGVVSAALA